MKKVIIIGGGFAGFSCAIELLKVNKTTKDISQHFDVTIIDAEKRLGGLAFSFIHEKKHIHTGYHQILESDKPLVELFKEVKLYDKISWKKCQTNILLDNNIYNMVNPVDFIKLPLSPIAKLRLAAFMVYCYTKKDWSDLEQLSAKEFIRSIAGEEIETRLFAPLWDIKFGMSAEQVSAAWVGARLAGREASTRFGCIQSKEWTNEVCKATHTYLQTLGCKFIFNTKVQEILHQNNKVTGVKINDRTIHADIVVSSVAPIILKRLVQLNDPVIDSIQYIDSISAIVSTKKTAQPFYWLMCMRPRRFIGGIFNLTDLNPTLGTKKEIILNFFTNVDHNSDLLKKTDKELLAIYKDEYKSIYKTNLNVSWYKINRIPFVSAKYIKGYKNPAIKTKIEGLYLCGNFMSYPSVTSTGTARQTGIDAAKVIVEENK